jgi:hypothetical protein
MLYSANVFSVHVMKVYGLRGSIDPASHKFGTRVRRIVIIQPRPSVTDVVQYEVPSGRCGEEKNPLSLSGIEPRFLDCRTRGLGTIPYTP